MSPETRTMVLLALHREAMRLRSDIATLTLRGGRKTRASKDGVIARKLGELRQVNAALAEVKADADMSVAASPEPAASQTGPELPPPPGAGPGAAAGRPRSPPE